MASCVAAFTHDGFWCQAEVQAHRRVLDLLDGWVGIMLAGEPPAAWFAGGRVVRGLAQPPSESGAVESGIPLIGLARAASATIGSRLWTTRFSGPPGTGAAAPPANRRAALLGGVGLARLAVGRSATALDLEVRGLDSYSGPHLSTPGAAALGGRCAGSGRSGRGAANDDRLGPCDGQSQHGRDRWPEPARDTATGRQTGGWKRFSLFSPPIPTSRSSAWTTRGPILIRPRAIVRPWL